MGGFGVDLGTANTVVCHTRRGLVWDQPSTMVVRTGSRRRVKPVSVGHEARALVGRTPHGLTVIRPLRDGVVTDLETARAFIRGVMRRLPLPPWQRLRIRAAIGVPVGSTTLERRALLEAAEEARIASAVLVPEPIAAALGCGVDPLESRTHMVLDVGGGTAEVTAFAHGGVIAHRSTRVAGDEMTLALYQYLREQYQLVLGEIAAEDMKIRAASEDTPSMVVQGQDAATGRPRLATLALDEIGEALRTTTDSIISTLEACLEDLPPQTVTDVAEDGIYLVGGGSLLRGFDKQVEEAFGFSIIRPERPLTCVAEGAARLLDLPPTLRAFALA